MGYYTPYIFLGYKTSPKNYLDKKIFRCSWKSFTKQNAIFILLKHVKKLEHAFIQYSTQKKTFFQNVTYLEKKGFIRITTEVKTSMKSSFGCQDLVDLNVL